MKKPPRCERRSRLARQACCSHRRLVALFAILSAVGACHNDPDALFEDSVTRDGGNGARDGSTAELEGGDIISRYADLGTGGSCVTCMREKCSSAERVCLADEACAEQARCEASCRDPQCMITMCPQYLAGTGIWYGTPADAADAGRPRPDRLPIETETETPAACRRRACSDECDVGRVFGCTGSFEWGRRPAGSTVPFTVVAIVNYATAARPSHVVARYCGGISSQCETVEPVTLELFPTSNDAPTVAVFGPAVLEGTVPGPADFIELQAPGFEPHLHAPLVSTEPMPLVVIPVTAPGLWAEGFRTLGKQDDPAAAFLAINVFDCMLDGAPGVRFDVRPVPTRALYWYDVPPQPGLDRTTPSGAGGAALLDEGLLDVRAILADGEQVVARRSVWTRSGTRSVVRLVPRSASEPP